MTQDAHAEGEGKGEALQEGDTLVTNHPVAAGGSHLPDITVVTPVFQDDKIIFFVASRGHHADVGGISPGSMPPNSKRLVEEGAMIVSFKLVKQGQFQVHVLSVLVLWLLSLSCLRRPCCEMLHALHGTQATI
jgi:5-oxoprolinase (ATP-hydrolysing)